MSYADHDLCETESRCAKGNTKGLFPNCGDKTYENRYWARLQISALQAIKACCNNLTECAGSNAETVAGALHNGYRKTEPRIHLRLRCYYLSFNLCLIHCSMTAGLFSGRDQITAHPLCGEAHRRYSHAHKQIERLHFGGAGIQRA